jgi:phosphopantothenate synthetase
VWRPKAASDYGNGLFVIGCGTPLAFFLQGGRESADYLLAATTAAPTFSAALAAAATRVVAGRAAVSGATTTVASSGAAAIVLAVVPGARAAAVVVAAAIARVPDITVSITRPHAGLAERESPTVILLGVRSLRLVLLVS